MNNAVGSYCEILHIPALVHRDLQQIKRTDTSSVLSSLSMCFLRGRRFCAVRRIIHQEVPDWLLPHVMVKVERLLRAVHWE